MRYFLVLFLLLTSQTFASDEHLLQIGNFKKSYPVKPAAANSAVGIVFLYDVSDNFHMAQATAEILSKSIMASKLFVDLHTIVVPGDGGNMMAGLLVSYLKMQKPELEVCIVRGANKGEVVNSVEYQSITSPSKKKINLRKDQHDRIQGKNVLLFDDVLSSGSTFRAVKELIAYSSCKVLAYACMATEGDDVQEFDGVSLFKTAHLPIFKL